MPGWIIQGVRGEGKSLCAVGKIKEYMLRGRPVATNLDLFVDKFLPEDNATISYRLPDHPRLEDFELFPPAYDPKYKKEDMNGLLVLDELGTWLNARNWNAKDCLKMLNWLFLSRKDHWDVILLAQDFEMIDAQVRTTLCDYLVQSSRSDRQKVPYLSGTLKKFGFSGKMPLVHRYAVYYGMTTAVEPEEMWSFTGTDFYDGYDTNQKFRDGMEALNGTLVDMRATYSNIPANYLTKRVFVDRLNEKITQLKQLTNPEVNDMAKGKGGSKQADFMKIGFLVIALIGFLGWRFLSGGLNMPKTESVIPQPAVAAPVVATPVKTVQSASESAPVETKSAVYVAQQTNEFIEYLLKTYRPRLSTTAYSPELGIMGTIQFYDNFEVVESYTVKELHSLGVTLLRKPYGVDLVFAGKSFIVSSWKLPHESDNQEPQAAQPAPVSVSQADTQPAASKGKFFD